MGKVKLLVTGSAGFIFSNFIRYVLKNHANYQIISVDRFSHKTLNSIYRNKGHIVHIGDVTDPHFIDMVFTLEQPDYVIHGAAESFVDHSIDETQKIVHSNVIGTQVIVDACVKHKINKLIYVSTDEVYGHLTSDTDPSWSEDAMLNPRNSYSATKAAGEMIVKAAANIYGLNYNITRSCNNYGPKQSVRNLIPVIISNILNNKDVPIYGQGMQIRDWIHVQDNCSAILNILENSSNEEIYNISSKQEFSNVEIFQEVCNTLGRGHNLLKFVKDRPGHDFRYSVTNDKIKKLGWNPSFKFKDGIVHTVNWYVNNSYFIRG
jgi:dTDP-glucose 4,6-dehydratase